MDDIELERVIADLVARKKALRTCGAEHDMLDRVLNGLRYSYEQAGPIWESLDTTFDATPP
jgi:hypothetical protein